jgi:hypothetical protein
VHSPFLISHVKQSNKLMLLLSKYAFNRILFRRVNKHNLVYFINGNKYTFKKFILPKIKFKICKYASYTMKNFV